ncbi:hypothetical protein [Nonomuraea sp. NPDC003754]
MTSSRRGRRGAGRPVVLFAALLAPAILAGGLLAGELVGYDAAVTAAAMEGSGEGRASRRTVDDRQAGGPVAGEQGGGRRAVGAAPGERPVVAGRDVGRMAFAPVPAPAPPHAERAFERLLPAPLGVETPETVALAVPRRQERGEEPAEARQAVPERPVRQEPARRGGCPDEWVDTWLWELCQEYQRKQA